MPAFAGVLLVMQRARVQSPRVLWGGVCLVLSLVLIALGIAYAVDGIAVAASSKPYEVVIRWAPGGMRGHGILMLTLGLALIHGLLPVAQREPMNDDWLHWTVLAVCFYSLWLVFAFAGSWWLNGQPTVGGIVWWLASAALAALLHFLPPPVAIDGRGERVA